ncbi:hypothetical protein PASE110613_07570 [Paenibacillus sediminis]|uniref:Exosome complex RNA-binding protein Csl4 n=1 Tax=Paenibacillus sediminis TaxID=664909 RepID=A0ABS4H3E1_9BACL|nr:hypothetical protein [Paenibacillus sediminis]MBP1936802.1 exosome complex RNA-binding protein Csl4 [Paenibacillus sediminis]
MSVNSHYKTARRYMNKQVKIKTKFGSTFYGKIVKVTKSRVYLKVSSVQNHKKVHTSFVPFILPLVLFDLLVIVLLDRPHRRRFY